MLDAMVEAAPLLAKDDDAGFMTKVALLLTDSRRSRKTARKDPEAQKDDGIDGFQMRHCRACPMSASPLCSTPSPRPRRRRRRIIPSAPSSPMSAMSRCPIRGWRRWPKSPARPRSFPPASPLWTSPGWCAAPPRAKGWATSSWPLSAKWTPSRMCCAVLRMTTSPMSKAASIPSAMPRRWKPN